MIHLEAEVQFLIRQFLVTFATAKLRGGRMYNREVITRDSILLDVPVVPSLLIIGLALLGMP